MAQYSYYKTQDQYDRELIYEALMHAIEQMGRAGSDYQERKSKFLERQSSLLETFTKLEPEQKQALIRNPKTRAAFYAMVDPDAATHIGRAHKGDTSALDQALEDISKPTEAQITQKATREAQQREATAKANTEEQKLIEAKKKNADSDAYDTAAAAYRKKLASGNTPSATDQYDLIQAAVAAHGPSVLQHSDALLDPALVRSKMAQDVIGTPEWSAKDVTSRVTDLLKTYQPQNRQDAEKLVQVVLATQPGSPVKFPEEMPKGLDQLRVDLEKRRVDAETMNAQKGMLETKANLYKYLSANAPEGTDLTQFVNTFMKTGQPPKGVLFPADKKQEASMLLEKAQTAEAQARTNELRTKDKQFADTLDAIRAAKEAGDETKAKTLMNSAMGQLKKKYPAAFPDDPGFFQRIFGALSTGASGVATGAALTGDVLGDAAAGARARAPKRDWLPPAVGDVIGAGRLLSDATAGPSEALAGIPGELATAAKGAAGYMLPKSVTDITGDIGTFIKQSIQDLGNSPSDSPTTQQVSPMASPAGGKPQALLDLRDQHLDKLNTMLPGMTDPLARQQVRNIALAYQQAGDDPEKLYPLMLSLGVTG